MSSGTQLCNACGTRSQPARAYLVEGGPRNQEHEFPKDNDASPETTEREPLKSSDGLSEAW